MSVYHHLDEFLALPRTSGLAASYDGGRVVATIDEINEEGTEYIRAIWEIDPDGHHPPRRLTEAVAVESSPSFTSHGELLFLAAGSNTVGDKSPTMTWLLPASGGHAVSVASALSGVTAVVTAREAPVAVLCAPMLPSADNLESGRRWREMRESGGVTAILHTGYPVRHREADLGPEEPHLFAVRLSAAGQPASAEVVELTPRPGSSLRESAFDVSADGQFVVTSWRVAAAGLTHRTVLVRIELATQERWVIADEPDADLCSPVISPDCSAVAYIRTTHATASVACRITVGILRFDKPPVGVASDWDRWPKSLIWAPDGSALIVTADDNGRCPVWRIDVNTGKPTTVASGNFAYSDVVAAPDGVIYALRSSCSQPPHPVRIDGDQDITVLPCADAPAPPGVLTEINAVSSDGAQLRSWLALPDGDGAKPLVLWVHGGPRDSWNSWSWECNPWLLAAQGYAVLLPDPALSTGYGQQFIQRGWGAWGARTFSDLMAITDVAVAESRIDGTRTALIGGSFGGYMANWAAGHTNRFAAIVSHAGIWALDQFRPTTDTASYWQREITPEFTSVNSPHRFVGQIRTPMLIIHGNRDYLVPVDEAMRMWFELLTESALPAAEDGTSPHRFLYFPSESHWVRSPQHARIWYQVIIAFLAEHVLGERIEMPMTLGRTATEMPPAVLR
ncbi:dipeptidyl aminopeptidase/acylaminoacyl peptidase [Mycobacterium sp. URHB0021]